MTLIQLIVAAIAYACGGLFMKTSAGLSRPGPTVAFLTLFVFAACVQALAMRQSDLGPSYIFVLGAEALVTMALSAWYLNEHWSGLRVFAVVLVVVGIAILRLP